MQSNNEANPHFLHELLNLSFDKTNSGTVTTVKDFHLCNAEEITI